MSQTIIAAIVAAVVSIIFNIVLAHHLAHKIERYEEETDNYAKDKLEEIKKLVVDAHFSKQPPTVATVGSEETKIKGITIELRSENLVVNIQGKKRGTAHDRKENIQFHEKTVGRTKTFQMQRENASCIKPDSYIGKEIQYQTALLHEILAEVRKNNRSYRVDTVITTDQLSAEDVRRECKNASVAEKSGLYEKAQKFAEGLINNPDRTPQEAAILPQLLEVLLHHGGAGEAKGGKE